MDERSLMSQQDFYYFNVSVFDSVIKRAGLVFVVLSYVCAFLQ